MKLEEVMYVRFKDGIIDKLIKKEEKENYFIISYQYDTTLSSNGYDENIAKASFNIIDLIEVGDYVNGGKVSRIENGYIVINEIWSGRELIESKDIKTILTKKQFENNCYKVGDE